MSKTLVLVVDRDDDFGTKGNVETPVIGYDAAVSAAIALGVADPEDSDVNALLAGMKIYREKKEAGEDVEIALICGYNVVGHQADTAVVKELEEVIDIVQPERGILVGDGAEDEFIYPIISTRMKIDSVRKVYVKQTPGIEGALYIFKKTLVDPQKRKRFLVPLGFLFVAIALVFIIINTYGFLVTNETQYLISLSWPIIVLMVGVTIVLYGYNSIDKFINYVDEWKTQLRDSSVALTFTVLALAMVVVGIVIGIYSIKNILTNGAIYVVLTLFSGLLWPFAFAYFLNETGRMLDELVNRKESRKNFMTSSIAVFGTAFIIQGAIDFVRNYVNYGQYDNGMIIVEIALGILFTLIASIIRVSYNRYYSTSEEAAADEA